MKKFISSFAVTLFAMLAPHLAQAQLTTQFECSYEAPGQLVITNFGNLPADSLISIKWNFSVDGVDGVILTSDTMATADGQITFSSETQGSLTYTIQSLTVRNSFFSDNILVTYANPEGQLGGVDPGPNIQNLTLANSNQQTGVFDILVNENYPQDADTLNQFSGAGASITQIDFNGIIRTVSVRLGEITGGCSQNIGQQMFVDVRPSSYPNIIRLNNQRFLVAIPGLANNVGFFDTIDKTSFNIQGVPAVGVRGQLSDFTTIGTELVTGNAVCQTGLPDGNDDLIVVWDSAAIISLYPDAAEGEQVPITIKANLLDGTAIFGNDFIVIDRGGL